MANSSCGYKHTNELHQITSQRHPQLDKGSIQHRRNCIKQTKITISVSRDKQRQFLGRFLKIELTRCSTIAERPRCRVRYSFRQK